MCSKMLIEINVNKAYVKVDQIPSTLKFFSNIFLLQFIFGWIFGLTGFFVKRFIWNRDFPPYYIGVSNNVFYILYVIFSIFALVLLAYEFEDYAVIFSSRSAIKSANLILISGILYAAEFALELFAFDSIIYTICLYLDIGATLTNIFGILFFVNANQQLSYDLNNNAIWAAGAFLVILEPLGAIFIAIFYNRIANEIEKTLQNKEFIEDTFNKLYDLFKHTKEDIYLRSFAYDYNFKDIIQVILINKVKEWIAKKEINGVIKDDMYYPANSF